MGPLSYHHLLYLPRLHHFVHPSTAQLLLDYWLLESDNNEKRYDSSDVSVWVPRSTNKQWPLLTQNRMFGWFPRWLH